MNLNRFEGFIICPTAHFLKTMRDKEFDPKAAIATIKSPTEVYPSGSHPGQWRMTGNGLCIVVKPEGNTLNLITVYLDRVLTAPRADQLATAEGRRYADRYSKGMGRG